MIKEENIDTDLDRILLEVLEENCSEEELSNIEYYAILREKFSIERDKKMGTRYVIGFTKMNNEELGSTFNNNIAKQDILFRSDYGFLGRGMYFVENNLTYTEHLWKKKYNIVGAVLDRKTCLDFMDNTGQTLLSAEYERVTKQSQNKIQKILSENVPNKKEQLMTQYNYKVMDKCIENINTFRKSRTLKAYDSVESLKVSGNQINGIFEYQDIVICVRNKSCIKEYFKPDRDELEKVMKKYEI